MDDVDLDVYPTDPVKVEAREGLSIWLEFADGASGRVDLSHLSDVPIFSAWHKREFFESVHINDDFAIEWDEMLQLCPDSMYLRVTGKSAEEVFPRSKGAPVDA